MRLSSPVRIVAQLRPSPLDGFVEAFFGVGLEQVIKRVDFESTDRVLVMRGCENHGGQSLGLQRFQHLEPVQAGHLDVQENQVGPVFLDRLNGVGAIGALGHNLHVFLCDQKRAHTLARKRFVIHDNDTQALTSEQRPHSVAPPSATCQQRHAEAALALKGSTCYYSKQQFGLAMGSYSDAPVHQHLLGVIEAGDLLKVRWLISAGADVNQPSNDPDGETPLLRAIAAEHLEIVRLLLEAGVDVNCRQAGPRSWTPLMYAHAHPEITRTLLEWGADVHACTPVREPNPADKKRIPHGRETALHLAAAANSAEVVQLLLAAGAEVEALTEDGLAPLDLALAPGRPNEVASLLVQAGAELSPERLENMHAAAHPADSHLWSFPWSAKTNYKSAGTAHRRKVPKAGEFRCPKCGAMLYSRRAKICGHCREPVPPELQLTDDDLRALREDRQWARDFAEAFGRGRQAENAPGSPDETRTDLPFSPEDLLRRVSSPEQFSRRERPEFWLYLVGYTVMAVVLATLGGSAVLQSPELIWGGFVVFALLCWSAWRCASPLCPNCKQNVKVCAAAYCHVCGKPLSTRRCPHCPAAHSWLRLLFPFARSGTSRWIAYCPGCGVWLDARIRRRRSR